MKKDLRILMIEDVPADAELIDSALRRGGFSFQAKRVDTQEEFLNEIEDRPPDMILSDHGLPSFDGFAALSITHEKCPDTPFIFVTGSMDEEVAANSLRDGATDHVLKTQLSNLAPAVQRALQLSEEKRKRKQAEIERHESEERFYQLVGGMKDCAFFMLDRDGLVSSWNAGPGRITGFQTSEIIGRPFGCCYRPEDRAVGRPSLDLKTALTEGRFEGEDWRVRQDGSRFWAHVVITALHDKNGDLNGFSHVLRDVTEARQAEESLRRSEETHRHLVEQCPGAIFVLRSGRIIFANATAHKLLGADKPGRLIGRRASDFIPAADREDFANRLRSLEETGTAATVESSPGAALHGRAPLFPEGTLVRLDERNIAVEFAARRVIFQEEPAIQLVAHDLTEQKERAAVALRQSEEQIRAQNFQRPPPAGEPGRNGANGTNHVNLKEEAAKLNTLEEELKHREHLLIEARVALKIREEFIEQSEALLLKKIETQQERESEIEQKQEELWHQMTQIGQPKDEILEPRALA